MRGLRRILNKVHVGIGVFERSIIIFALLICLSMISIEVVTRYVFRSSIFGMDELAGYVGIWVYLMGAAYGSYDRCHIKTEITQFVVKNKRWIAILRTVSAGFSFIISCILVIWAYQYLSWSISKGQKLITHPIPTAYFQFAILLGAVLMATYFLVEMVDLGKGIKDQKVESE